LEIILKDKKYRRMHKEVITDTRNNLNKIYTKRKTKSKSDIPRERKKLFGRMKKLKLSKKKPKTIKK